MSEQDDYTPSVEDIREYWVAHRFDRQDAYAEVDRMIDQVRREAVARQILKDAVLARNIADALANGGCVQEGDVTYSIADEIREQDTDE